MFFSFFFFFSSRRRHTRFSRDWSSDVCSSDLDGYGWKRCARGRIERLTAGDRIGRECGVDASDQRLLGARGESEPQRVRVGNAPGGIFLDAVDVALTIDAR